MKKGNKTQGCVALFQLARRDEEHRQKFEKEDKLDFFGENEKQKNKKIWAERKAQTTYFSASIVAISPFEQV